MVVFKEDLSVNIEFGRPLWARYPRREVVQYAREEGWQREYVLMPDDDLKKMHRALEVAMPPKELVVSAAGQLGLKSQLQTIFGSGQRGSTDIEWHPTDIVIDGCRAWARHQRWQEGGGEGWFGSPIYHDWIVAGAWIRDVELLQWAGELFEHPLGKLIEDNSSWRVVADADPRLWSGVEIEKESLCFYDEYYAQPAGVYRNYTVKWGLCTVVVSVYLPDYWQIQVEAEWEHPVCYPFRVARNGREEKRFAPPYSTLEGDRSFLAAGESKGWRVADYVTELPDLPEYLPPTEAGGDYATFWPSREAWEDFARRHNIRAKRLSLGLHAPDEGEAGAVCIPLSSKLAQLAWAQGEATSVPEIIGEIPPLDQWEYQESPVGNSYWNRSYIQIGRVTAYCFGAPRDGVSVFLSEGGGNSGRDHRGWVRVPPDRKITLAFGLSVRDVGDLCRDRTETVVYTDGRILFGER